MPVGIMIPCRRRAGRRGQAARMGAKGRRAELPDARPPQAPLQPFIRCTCDFRQVATTYLAIDAANHTVEIGATYYEPAARGAGPSTRRASACCSACLRLRHLAGEPPTGSWGSVPHDHVAGAAGGRTLSASGDKTMFGVVVSRMAKVFKPKFAAGGREAVA
jgi:hypothetical protein